MRPCVLPAAHLVAVGEQRVGHLRDLQRKRERVAHGDPGLASLESSDTSVRATSSRATNSFMVSRLPSTSTSFQRRVPVHSRPGLAGRPQAVREPVRLEAVGPVGRHVGVAHDEREHEAPARVRDACPRPASPRPSRSSRSSP